MLIQSLLFVVLIVGGKALISWPLGRYLKWAMVAAHPAAGVAGWKTRAFRAVGGPSIARDQDWKRYMAAMLAFNVVMFTVTFGVLALQQYLPIYPDGKEAG